MILKLTRGEHFAFVDNEGEVLHEVKVSGNNKEMVESLSHILNVRTAIRFKGELNGIPDEVVTKVGDKPVEINKASDIFIRNHFIDDMKLQGFEVEIIKE